MADGPVSPGIESEIERLESEGRRFRRGELGEEAFRETRLRLGVRVLRGGADRFAVRVKVPLGVLSPGQLEAAAAVAEGSPLPRPILLTARQGFEIHGVDGEEAGPALRRLAAAGLPVDASGGDRVRNVTACAWAGVAPDEAFDVTPYAWAVACRYVWRPAFTGLPRAARIAFEGCPVDHVHAAAADIGFHAVIETRGGPPKRGFRVRVGGGLGPDPRAGGLLEPFTPADGALATAEAVLRIFDRLGDRTRRSRARLRHLVGDLGIEAFREEVLAVRDRLVAAGLREDPSAPHPPVEGALPGGPVPDAGVVPLPDAFPLWTEAFVRRQKQPGFVTVRVRGETGRFTAGQVRVLADLARRVGGGRVRLTHLQDVLLRWVPEGRAPAVFARLAEAGLIPDLDGPGRNLTCCAGSQACPWAVTDAPALAGVLRAAVSNGMAQWPEVTTLRLGISGCPRGCGHQRLSDIGFGGVARPVGGRTAPVYQVFAGAMLRAGGPRFATPLVEIPARRVPEALRRLITLYREARWPREDWAGFVDRMGINPLRWLMSDLAGPVSGPPPADLFRDWGSEEEFRLGARKGEGAY